MIKKKVSPIIARPEAVGKGKIVGINIEYRLFGLVVYTKIIYMPSRYDNVDWYNQDNNQQLVSILLNQ